MKLKHPNSEIDFIVGPSYFLGCLDIYDQEETLGSYLSKFNPNDKIQLHFIFNELFFNNPRTLKLTHEHKVELLRALKISIEDNNFDFGALLPGGKESDDYFTLPDNWEIENPRTFFEEIYSLARISWQHPE